MSLIAKYKEFPDHVLLRLYRHRLPKMVAAMRAKPRVKVLFVLHCLDKWKTEGLYRQMARHERFEPVLGLAMSLQDYPSAAVRKFQLLEKYVAGKGYDYVELCQKDDLDRIAPDIIFYTEPYNGVINRGLEYRNAPRALFCFSTYGIHTVCYKWSASAIFYKFLWQDYYESELATRSVLEMCPSRRNNLAITGTPFADMLLEKPGDDPWKPSSVQIVRASDSAQPCRIVHRTHAARRKRIIYAPHFSIVAPHDPSALYLGTFLQFGEAMLDIARRHADKVQWAFKPHPSLRRELTKQWGEERTERYYRQWAEMENGQYAEGQYLDLFKHSDAMIHDCSSFICEYLYMCKPVLFLDNGNKVSFNHLAQAALKQHYHAQSVEQIERFVENVACGIDPRGAERQAFVERHLMPPNGRTAAENIMDAILGQ